MESVNGKRVMNMKELVRVVDEIVNSDEEFLRFQFSYQGSEIIMLTSQLRDEQPSILKTYSIPKDRSDDLE